MADVLGVLRAKLFREPAHAWLYEVRNATGFAANRAADAVVVSCWPSRGIWFAGIELKTHRSDWLREIKDPSKAEAIGRYCHYWWVATTEGVVVDGEVPEAWGHVVVRGKAAEIQKQAPRREPEPPTAGFVAAMLRNQADAVERRVKMRDDERALAEAERTAPSRAEELEEKLREATRRFDALERAKHYSDQELARARQVFAEFRGHTGMSLDGYQSETTFEALRMARAMGNLRPRVLAEHLENVLREVRDLEDAIAPQANMAG